MRNPLILLSLLFLFSLKAYAINCGGQFDPVSGSCRIIGPDGREIIYNSDPPQATGGHNFPNQVSRIIYRAPKYGALAINKDTGAVADAHNQNSKSKAKQLALTKLKCKKNESCNIIAVVSNGCIAAAFGYKNNGAIIVGTGVDVQGKSESEALYQCARDGGSNCKIFIPENCSHPSLSEN